MEAVVYSNLPRRVPSLPQKCARGNKVAGKDLVGVQTIENSLEREKEADDSRERENPR